MNNIVKEFEGMSSKLAQEIVAKHDVDKILKDATFFEVKKAVRRVMESKKEPLKIKYHVAEVYLHLGIATLYEIAVTVGEQTPRKVELPLISLESLKYHYTNDKTSFKT